jgi:hypothetical protein
MRVLYLFYAFVFFLFSCIKEVNSDFNFEDKMVVYCYVSPQDSISKLLLIQNQPITASTGKNSENYPYIKNAKVEISDGTKSTMFLLYEDNLKSFYYVDSISFKFQEGKKYDLNILSDGKEINSSMTIPNGAEILKIAYDTSAMSKLELKNGLSTVNRDVNLSIEINGKDYYCFVSAVVFGSCFIQTASGSINKKIEKHIYFNTDPTLPMKLDGKNNFNVTDKLSLSTNHSIVSYTLEFDSIQYYTVTIEENYYEYLKSKKLQSSSQNDPFAEPSLLYSNVYNGLGIFTGIASRKSIATFK